MSYQRRVLDNELDEVFPHLPALAVEGAKGVGKTETAKQRAQTIFNLDVEASRDLIVNNPELINSSKAPVFLDEWQRHPPLWDMVRRSVDAHRAPGRFLLAGSATPEPTAAIHSGAGRIVSLRMRPMALCERGIATPRVSLAGLLTGSHPDLSGECALTVADYAEEIVASGFPGIRNDPPRIRALQLDSYLQRIVEHDLPELGHRVRRPQILTGWLTAYAAATATTTEYQSIAVAANPGETSTPAKSTTIAYRDLLERMFLLEPLPAWLPSRNPMSRLRRGPKHYLADPALAARLLGATKDSLLGGQGGVLGSAGALAGNLFEALALLCVRVAAQAANARVFHLRTQDGAHEVDMIVQRDDGAVMGIEVKLASAINAADGMHLRWLADQLQTRLLDSIILTSGPYAYRRNDGVGIVPLALLGP